MRSNYQKGKIGKIRSHASSTTDDRSFNITIIIQAYIT